MRATIISGKQLACSPSGWPALVLLAITVFTRSSVAQSQNKISTPDRVLIASRIYHQISTFFPDLKQKSFDEQYSEYLKLVLSASDDRRDFDLASMALVATLHDGHTWFYDHWFDQAYGRPVGLAVYPLGQVWVVVQTGLASVKLGDIVVAVDGTPTQQYFERNRKYISALKRPRCGR